MPASKRPQIYYNSSYAHSGDYSLLMNYRGVYAMPLFELEAPISQVSLKMYLRQAKSQYMLEVGVLEDDETFVPVVTINNQSTGVEQVVCSFASYTGNGSRIAFRNVLAEGYSSVYSYNYIDDINLTYSCPSISLPYTEDFDSYTTSTTAATGEEPTCWELVREDVTMPAEKRPQIYYNSNYAHSGDYSLAMNYRGVYAMPALDVPINQVSLKMYVRQPRAQYMLEVGVLEDNGTFVPVVTVNNQSTGVERVVCSFASYSGNGSRIAFRNVLAEGYSTVYSYNYIDDINLSNDCQPISLPYTEDFENITTSTTTATGVEPDCWDLVHEDVSIPTDKRPQIVYNSSYAHNSDYSLGMNYRGIYAMPALDAPISQVSLDMYVRQPRAQYMLEVGVLEDNGTFVPVDTINNRGTGVKHVVCSFEGYTGNGHRIAFHNILAEGYSSVYSYNYIDDINITRVVNKGSVVTNTDADNHDVLDAAENVNLYPNPTTGLIHIDAEKVQRVECYTMMGQKVAVFEEERDIDISQLPAGVYMFRITMPQGEIMRKVVRK
jgi:hypothetical protein